ncbi:MAG: Rid family detoxifying hydrolase [Spirochaetes bacterium]|nr:Rid family detoxifying hydrolase [Spirochaetota bacterium]
MSATAIATDAAPKAIGPYSQAVKTGSFIFCSGQLGLDPASGALADGVKAQAGRALDNLKAVLAAAGAGPANVVKTTIFLADMRDFAIVNEVYASVFPADPPARSTVQVAGLPKGALVEIEAIAVA